MRRWIAFLAIALALAACSSGGGPKGTAEPTSPSPTPTKPLADHTGSEILAAAAAAATAKGSVHTVATSKQGSKTARIVNDTGPDRGRQVITIGSQRVDILLVDKIVYMRGNEAALRDFFGFPPEFASRYADEWISFTESDPGYGDLAETLDMPSLNENITLTGTLDKKVTTISGTSVIAITGDHPQGGTGTLYVAATGDPLPIRMDVRDQNDSDSTVLFSDWGKAVAVTVPSGATPYSSIQG